MTVRNAMGHLPLETEILTDAEMLKNTEARMNELRELKAAGVRRGDVEQLPELEKQVTNLRKKANSKK